MLNGFLRQSTASQARNVGPFVDDTDFKTLETALTINNTDVKLSKNGAAVGNKNSGGGSHISNGFYALTFDATDSNTVGELQGSIAVTGALVVAFKFVVLEEAIYDALYAAGATGFGGGGSGVGANIGELFFQREFNQPTIIDGITLLDSSGEIVASPTIAAGDVKVSIDGATAANISTLPALSGGSIRVTLSALETQGKRIVVSFDDQTGPPEWRSKRLIIETYGHTLAQHAFNLNSATVEGTLDTSGLADAVWAKTLAEPTTVPTWPMPGSSALAWVAALSRNKIEQTLTQIAMRNDLDTENIGVATITKTVSTVTRAEWV